MPVAATSLAEIVTRDPQPLVVARRGEHALEQLPVAALELGPLAKGQAGVLDAIRELVADRLELAQAKRAGRRCASRDVGRQAEPREGLGEERGKLPFEASHLSPQLGAGEALAAAYLQLVPAL